MGYSYTNQLAIPYPDGAEDLDIPGDMQFMAEAIDTNVSGLLGNNVVGSAEVFLTETPPDPNVEVIGSKMNIYLAPPDLSGKLDSAGGTITGNLQINGDLTFGAAGGVSVPTPAAAMDPVTLQYLEDQMFGKVDSFAIPAANLPPGWYICDGSAHGNTRLTAAIGPNTPDLRAKFIIGATGETGAYIRGQAYGAASVTLTTNELPSHSHTINSGDATHGHTITVATGGGSKTPSGTVGNANIDHTHSGTSGYMNQNWSHAHNAWTTTDGGHSHGSNYTYNFGLQVATQSSGRYVMEQNPWTGAVLGAGGHGHGVAIEGIDTNHTHSFGTGGMSANATHNHTFTGSAMNIDHSHTATTPTVNASHTHTAVSAGNGNAFSIIPPSYALIYAIFGGTL